MLELYLRSARGIARARASLVGPHLASFLTRATALGEGPSANGGPTICAVYDASC